MPESNFVPYPIVLAILANLLLPIVLVLTRYLPGIADDASRRYAASCLVTAIAWIGLATMTGKPIQPDMAYQQLFNGLLVLLSGFVVTLGLWGLLTRGCSVSILLALTEVGPESSATALGGAYSGGRGLRWLTDKRLNSLAGAGFVDLRGSSVRVTRPLGASAAVLCVLLARTLGLKSAG